MSHCSFHRFPLLRSCLAEAFATFIMMLFGQAVVAQKVIGQMKNGGYEAITAAWGMGVMFGIYVGGAVSGAHMNPSVTIALAAYRSFPARHIIPYVIAQFIGSIIASVIVYVVYYDGIMFIDNGQTLVTAGIFTTFPSAYLSIRGAIIDQIVGTAVLMIGIFALSNERHQRMLDITLSPFLTGLLVATIGMCFGANCGYPINPIRDFPPRLFTYIAGYGAQVFPDDYWWIPIIFPPIGAMIGGGLYDICITLHQSDQEKLHYSKQKHTPKPRAQSDEVFITPFVRINDERKITL